MLSVCRRPSTPPAARQGIWRLFRRLSRSCDRRVRPARHRATARSRSRNASRPHCRYQNSGPNVVVAVVRCVAALTRCSSIALRTAPSVPNPKFVRSRCRLRSNFGFERTLDSSLNRVWLSDLKFPNTAAAMILGTSNPPHSRTAAPKTQRNRSNRTAIGSKAAPRSVLG